MSDILDRVFANVCLDNRIADGIFRMEEQTHMDALREYFVKKGIAKEAAIHVTNRMVEGKYPERQTYRKEDGILVTFPSPQHKAKAMAKNPGKYTDKDPKPPAQQPKEEPKQAPPGSKPEPGELPADTAGSINNKPLPKSNDDDTGNDIGGGDEKEPTIFQGDKKLEIEPPRGAEISQKPPEAPSPTVPPAPRTPERIAAEKEIAKQLMNTDDTTLSNIATPVYEETLRHQLQELYKKADEMGYREAVKFLTSHVKP